MKMLYILNTTNRVNNFSYSSMVAAQELGIEFHIAGNWTGYNNSSERREDEKKYGIKIHQIDFIRAPYDPRNIKAYKQVIELLKREKFDVIHCNTPIGGVIGRLAGKRCDVKTIIYQAHGFHFYKGAPKINWLIYYPIEKWLAHYTDALITINHEDYIKAQTFHLNNHGKVYYVPGVGIDLSEFDNIEQYRKEKRLELGLKDDDIAIISVGELNKNKNNSTIILALDKIKNSSIHYFLCGTGEEQNNLQVLVEKLGLEKNVHFLGYRKDIKELYSATDFFVMPSIREGLSRSIMEAMASGLPCIVSKIRGNVDLIENNIGGILCSPNSAEEFANAIEKCIFFNSKELGKNNLERIKKFDIHSVKKELLNIYTKVVI